MKGIKFFLLSVLCGFLLTGCPGDDPENDREILINFSAIPLSDMVLKSTATTNESLVSKMLLIGVDDKNVPVKIYPVISNPALTGMKLTMPLEVKTLYAIANPSSGMESATPSTFSDLSNLTGDFSTAPQSPFLMGGKGDIVGSSATIELIRAVAKIEVIAPNELEIESVTVKNTPNKAYVFKKDTRVAPTNSVRVDYLVNTVTTTVYVAECSKDNPVELEVIGMYLGQEAKYTIRLNDNGAPIDIARNTHYQVNITPLSNVESNVSITIPAWDDVRTDDHMIPK